ncbi:hypothetical protein WJX81_000816 [Elliptochloris bilobata]|uniref:S1-like domain-containing protein n=1 Tax=Elliptochloris bilobata TaxID=381761 RepID=A0AAW1RC49_9CHLO
MSKRRCKHVLQSALQDAVQPPTGCQSIVRAVGSRGGNHVEVEFPDGRRTLAMLPARFNKKLWVRRGGYLVVEEAEDVGAGAVSALIVSVLYSDGVRALRKLPGVWPAEFAEADAHRLVDVLSSSRFLVTVSSLHLFNLALCLLLFVATKEHRDRLASWPECLEGAGCAAGAWQAAAACGWSVESDLECHAHGRPLRSLFKSHYCAVPAVRRASAPALARTATPKLGLAMDDLLDDLLGSAVARLMTAGEVSAALDRRAHSAPPEHLVRGCEWAEE